MTSFLVISWCWWFAVGMTYGIAKGQVDGGVFFGFSVLGYILFVGAMYLIDYLGRPPKIEQSAISDVKHIKYLGD